MRLFNPTSSHPVRAVQAWQILAAAAMNRQTLTYKILSRLMYGKEAAGVLKQVLAHVAFYCIDARLPPLTSIVVGTGRGTPGSKIPINLEERDVERERVYETDWYDIFPPSAEELAAAHEAHERDGNA